VTMPATAECWWSQRALYLSAFRRDGTLMDASGINVDTGRWWEYDAEQGTLYVADFKRFASNLVRVLAKATPVAFSALHRSLFGIAPPDAKKSVTFKTRHGRRIAVITATFKAKGSPLHQEGKDVVEVDTETNHLLSSLTYIRLGDEPWQLFFIGMDDIEWDVPVPRHLAAPKIPQGTKAVHVAATVAETDDVLTLEMTGQALTEEHQTISMHFKKK